MLGSKVALDQWRTLIAVVETGGYVQAAEQLHKTQSTVSYAVQKIEQILDVKLFAKQGRKAVLTPAGGVLYRRARTLIERACALERSAADLRAGWDPELRMAAEIVFPTWLLLGSLARFGQERPQTDVQLFETVLGGTDEALYERQVDMAITPYIPQGFSGDPLMQIRFIAAAHPDHALHQLQRPLSLDDLREHRHLVIRDSAAQRTRDSGGWFGADQRWTFSHKASQIAAACRGLGFAWFPEDSIRSELEEGALKPLPMREGAERFGQVYLIFTDADLPTASAVRMAEILREDVASLCPLRDRGGTPAIPRA